MPTERYHVFLSYNSADKPAVEALAMKLRAAGINPWLDDWNLIPGTPWMEEIEAALESCESCAVFFGADGSGPWQNEEMRTALDRRVRETGFRVIPVLLPGGIREERSALPGFLTRLAWVKFRDLEDSDGLRRLLAGIRNDQPGPRPGPVGECPYRGLRYFDVADADIFCGRATLVDLALDVLRGRPDGRETNRFLGIVGPSGSGKSSFARAGLLASLKAGEIEGSAEWPLAICRPGANPAESLSVALAEKVADALSLASQFQSTESALHVTARMMLKGGPAERRLVVLVDQFEECFTVCRDKAVREAFFRNLVYAATIAQGQTIVLVAMRADFYGDCAAYPELAAAISGHHYLIGPMEEHELREAIEVPARKQSVEFEHGLVELLLEQVKDQPGALPLLQYTLQELWNLREGARLTHAAYQSLGKVKGVLGRRADEILNRMNPADQAICRHIMVQLAQHVEGDKYTRRRLTVPELASTRFDEASLGPVLNELAGEQARLIVIESDDKQADIDVVELAHEALIEGWPRFQSWLNDDRDFQRWRQRLRPALENWRDTKKNPAASLRGVVLDEALNWVRQREDRLSSEESEFIKASEAHRIEEEAQARAQRRKLRIAVAAGVTLLVAGAVSLLFAQRESRLAESRRLAAAARNGLVRSDPSRALPLFLALHSVAIAETQEAKEALHQAVQFAGGAVIAGSKSPIADFAYSPDGLRLATAEGDGTTRIWDVKSKRQVRELIARPEPIYSVVFSPDGRQLATGARDTATVWDAGTGSEVRSLPRQPDAIMSVAFAADGKHLVTGCWDGTVTIWDIGTGAVVHSFPKQAPVAHIAVSPDGRSLASAHSDGTLKLWDLASGAETRVFPGRQKALKWVAFSPDGKHLASAVWDGGVTLWESASGHEVRSFVADADGLSGVAFSPDGGLMVTAGLSGHAKIWDSQSGREMLTLLGPDDALTAAAFAPSKEPRVAVSSRDQTVRIYELDLERLKQQAIQLIRISASPLTAQNCAAYPGLKPCP